MNKESLMKARKIIVEGLNKEKMDDTDRVELMINLWNLLDEDNYEHDIDTLRRYSKPNTEKQKRRKR